MKNNNYYLRKIANNTGSEISKMKNDLYYLKRIAQNLGNNVTGKLKNRNHYLKLISESTEDYGDSIALIADEDIILTGDEVDFRVRVKVDGEYVQGRTVYFYRR